jgi:hypothetical protein
VLERKCGLPAGSLGKLAGVNLLSSFQGKQLKGKGDLFSLCEAEAAARSLLPRLRGRLVLAAGKGVARAFGLTGVRWFETVIAGDVTVATVPHLSGVNRWWNNAANRELAGKKLLRLLGKERSRLRVEGGRKK